jgi:hypothetical protein
LHVKAKKKSQILKIKIDATHECQVELLRPHEEEKKTNVLNDDFEEKVCCSNHMRICNPFFLFDSS